MLKGLAAVPQGLFNYISTRHGSLIGAPVRMIACLIACYVAWYAGTVPQEFPAWFFQMPEDDEAVYSVGYARAYARYDSAATIAARNARYQLNLAILAALRGERLFQTLPGGQIVYQGEKFEERPMGAVNPVYLDTVQVGGMVLVLASSRLPQVSILSTPTLHTISPPSWITTLPDSLNAMYAVGMSRLYYYEEHSWLEAERQARQELAFSFWTRQRQFLRGTRDEEFGVTASGTSVQLHGTQVVARWRSDTMCFVLVKTKGGSLLE